MADQNPTAPDAAAAPPSTVDQDLEDQALVLDRLLIHWPSQLQESDLLREVQFEGDDFNRRDRVERAVHQLYGAGLAVRSGPMVVPTRAALHYRVLSDETSVDL